MGSTAAWHCLKGPVQKRRESQHGQRPSGVCGGIPSAEQTNAGPRGLLWRKLDAWRADIGGLPSQSPSHAHQPGLLSNWGYPKLQSFCSRHYPHGQRACLACCTGNKTLLCPLPYTPSLHFLVQCELTIREKRIRFGAILPHQGQRALPVGSAIRRQAEFLRISSSSFGSHNSDGPEHLPKARREIWAQGSPMRVSSGFQPSLLGGRDTEYVVPPMKDDMTGSAIQHGGGGRS